MALKHIAVLGGGAWGTALALTCARAGRSVTLWEHDAGNVERLRKNRESAFLPGIALDERIVVATDLAEAAGADAILAVVPAQAVRAVMQKLSPFLAQDAPVIVCAKGIERGSKKFMTEVIAECAPKAMPPMSRAACRPRSRLRQPMARLPPNWRRRSARPRSVPIIRATSAASRLAARRKTCSRLPRVWSPAASSAPVRLPL